ncbi:MAG: hypothetical protein FWG05_05420, partial [Kiritimatiellaeota bacterium]|nr:hypothetical protein [Kiritimatiellota bacterium]
MKLIAFAIALLLWQGVHADTGANLVKNGKFDPSQAGWHTNEFIRIEKDEARGNVLVLRNTRDKSVKSTQGIKREPEWAKLKFSYWVNVPSITPGSGGHQHARFTVTMIDANHHRTDVAKEDKQTWHLLAGAWKEPTDGWVRVEEVIDIPSEVVTSIIVGPAIFDADG